MEANELLQHGVEVWSHSFDLFAANFEWSKAIAVCFAFLSGVVTIYVKWRNSGYRQVDRLHEFLSEQELRLDSVRGSLAALAQIPTTDRPIDDPSFSLSSLGRAMRKMDWGFGTAAVNDLHGAVRISADQSKLSIEQAGLHRRRQALAHLLLGAKAASNVSSDPEQRCVARSTALAEFEKAIALDPNDADATEYAGMMLLQLKNPGAVQRFNELVQLRQAKGGGDLARAYRLLASAYESEPVPRLRNANNALSLAIKNLPEAPVLARALTHEHQGNIRLQQEFFDAAQASYRNALIAFELIRETPVGKAGLTRTRAALENLNQPESEDYPELDGLLPLASPPSTGLFR